MSILTEAEGLINGARQSVYAHPFDNFTQTAALWSPILGMEVTPEQVALCMIQVKVSRLCNTPNHRDSIVDIAGYAGTYEKVQERRAEHRIEIERVFAATREPGPIVPLTPMATNHPITDAKPPVLEEELE